MDIEFGTEVKDGITGLVGVVTARVEYLHDTPDVRVESLDPSTGRIVETWISPDRLKVVN